MKSIKYNIRNTLNRYSLVVMITEQKTKHYTPIRFQITRMQIQMLNIIHSVL